MGKPSLSKRTSFATHNFTSSINLQARNFQTKRCYFSQENFYICLKKAAGTRHFGADLTVICLQFDGCHQFCVRPKSLIYSPAPYPFSCATHKKEKRGGRNFSRAARATFFLPPGVIHREQGQAGWVFSDLGRYTSGLLCNGIHHSWGSTPSAVINQAIRKPIYSFQPNK
jgi:hypothetical protein